MNGFIQIPVLLAILISAVVFGGGGYLVAEKMNRPLQIEETAVTQISEQVATTTEATPTAKPPGEPKDESVTKTQSPVAGENFNTTLILAIEKSLPAFEDLKEYVENLIALVDNRIELLDSLTSSAAGAKSRATDSQARAIYQLFLDAYSTDRNLAIATKKLLNTYLEGTAGIISISNNYIVELKGMTISRERLISESTSLSKANEFGSQSFADAKRTYQSFKERADERDELYIDLWDKVENYYGSQISQLEKASYVPAAVYVPPYNPPRFTNCVVSSYQGGGSINCATY